MKKMFLNSGKEELVLRMKGYINAGIHKLSRKKFLGTTSKFQALDWLHEACSIPTAQKLRLGSQELCLLALVYIHICSFRFTSGLRR